MFYFTKVKISGFKLFVMIWKGPKIGGKIGKVCTCFLKRVSVSNYKVGREAEEECRSVRLRCTWFTPFLHKVSWGCSAVLGTFLTDPWKWRNKFEVRCQRWGWRLGCQVGSGSGCSLPFSDRFCRWKVKKIKKSPKSYRQNISLRRCRVMNVDTAVFNKLSYI